MVLRSGIILPFQFRECKKLLMIGVPEENRDLSVWDLKNVVRAAFGIYNFEFRNKKIGFNIPDELLLQYLGQRHDLTNFVIEVDQGDDNDNNNDATSINDEGSPIISMHNMQKSNDSEKCGEETQRVAQLNHHHPSIMAPLTSRSLTPTSQASHPPPPRPSTTPAQQLNNSDVMQQQSDHSSSLESSHRMRAICRPSYHGPNESLKHSMSVMPKSEITIEPTQITENRLIHSGQEQQSQQQHAVPGTMVDHTLHQLQPHHQQHQPHFISNYGHHPINLLSIAVNNVTTTTPSRSTQLVPHGGGNQATPSTPAQPPTQYSANINRFRRRGERMSKDQKELYVKYFEENPSMLAQRRNDMLVEPLWNKLAHLLNSVPQGAVKNVEEWKQTFDAWRYRVFMYTRYNSKLAVKQDINPKVYKPLTATDQRAYAMWTSHKSLAIQEFDRIDMFTNMDTTQTGDYDY